MAEVQIDGKELMQQITISLRMPPAFGFRMWLTARILALAGIVSPVQIEAEIHD
jgi:hypothetical protein